MTKKLQSDRVDETANISTGPDDINQLEVDVADTIGFDSDQLYAASPFSFDSDGNITSQRTGESPHVMFKDAENVVGLRLWDSDNDKEVLLTISDDKFMILENTGTAGGSMAQSDGHSWERFIVDLDGVGGVSPGQSFLNHSDVPSSFTANEYLRANSDGDALEFASFDAATPPSCGTHNSSISLTQVGNFTTWRAFPDLTMAWDTADMYKDDTVDYIEVPSTGVYAISMNFGMPTYAGGMLAIGWGAGATGQPNDMVRYPMENVDPAGWGNGIQQVSTVFVEELTALQKVYPKVQFYINSASAQTCGLNRFSVTKLSST